MKQPTLKQLIEQADTTVNVEHWIRLGDITEWFSVSKSQATYWVSEMSEIEDFKGGIVRPGHSITLVHYHTLLWYLRWKDENKGLKRKIPPKEINGYYWKAV